MNQWLEIMIVLSMAGSTVVACMLVLNLISQKVFTAKWQYLLRKMAIFFFLVPIWFIVERFVFFTKETDGIFSIMMSGYWGEIIPQQSLSIELAIFILSIWGMGVIVFAGWHVYCYGKFNNEVKKNNLSLQVDYEAYQLLTRHKEKLKIRRNVKLVYNDHIASPSLVGLLNPMILLPTRKISTEELSMVLRHELIHFKRKDLWIRIFMLVVNALHWFNPLVYNLRNQVQTWSELACDEEVVTDMSRIERKRYGEMILNMLEESNNTPILYGAFLSGNKNILKKRLTMLLEVKPMKKFTLALATTIIISVGIIGITVSALAEASPITFDEVKTDRAILSTDDAKEEEVDPAPF